MQHLAKIQTKRNGNLSDGKKTDERRRQVVSITLEKFFILKTRNQIN